MALVPGPRGTGKEEMKFSNCLLNLAANRLQPNRPCLFQIELKVNWSRSTLWELKSDTTPGSLIHSISLKGAWELGKNFLLAEL